MGIIKFAEYLRKHEIVCDVLDYDIDEDSYALGAALDIIFLEFAEIVEFLAVR